MEAALQTIKDSLATAESSAREKAIASLKDLLVSVETPIETLNRLGTMQLPASVARAAIDMQIYNILAESKGPLTAEEIAEKSGAASFLTARLLRYLVSLGLIDEVGKDQFAANKKTVAFADPAYQGGLCHFFETVAPTFQAIPAYLKEHRYQDVVENTQTAFNLAFKTDLPGFIWFQTQPQNFAWFNQYMPIQRQGLPDWLSAFPVQSELADWQQSSEKAVFVDIGGGFGHQALAFHSKFPNVSGRIIVQDIPPVLEHAQLPAPIEKMPQNFFEPQPIKGAKFYYLRNILHDYPDEKASDILANTASAMNSESLILIDEMSLPEKGVPQEAAFQDLTMMFALGSIERTTEQWYALLDKAGLKVKQIHKYTNRLNDTVIAAVPK